jgi:tyrosine-protein kinase Etk/Wzc
MKVSDLLLDEFEPKKQGKINYKFIILKYLKFWYLYLLGLIICVALAVYYLKSTTELYPVSSTILINSSNNASGSDFSQNAIYSDLEGYQSTKVVENEAEVLKSVSLMGLTLKELDFNVSYFINDNPLRDKEIFVDQSPVRVILEEYDSTAFFSKGLETNYVIHFLNKDYFMLEDEAENKTRHAFDEEIEKPFGKFKVQLNNLDQLPEYVAVRFNNPYSLAGQYAGKLDVFIVNKLASVLRISLNDAVPQKGVLVINKLIEIYNREAIKNKNATAANTLEFVEGQLGVLRKEISEIEAKVERYKTENRITEISMDAQQYSATSRTIQDQISDYNIRLEVLRSIEEYLIEQDENFQAVPSTLNIQDQTLLSLVQRFNELQKDRERMLRTTNQNNPLVQDLTQQLVSTRRNLLENIRNITRSMEASRQNVMTRAAEAEQKSGRIPEIERRLLEITREKDTKQAHYNYLVEKREEAALSLAATTVSNSRIIDPAMAGGKPVKPNKMLILGFAVFFGFFTPLGFVFIRYKITDKIISKQDISERTSLPFLGEISHNKQKSVLVISKSIKDALAEQFRLIRTNIQFALPTHDRKVLMITSSMGGEGKTFFSINLAVSLALAGKRVALCEFDLRKPALLDYLNMDCEIGITNFLSEDGLVISDLINKHQILPDNLHIFGCGDIPEDPAELMLKPKVGYMIERLKENYDVVILDTAPIGQVSDSFALSRFVDMSIYLMRNNYTPVGMVDFVNDVYRDRKLKNPYLVLNDVKLQANYGYGYKYGYYHTNTDKKKAKKKGNYVLSGNNKR